MAFPGVFCLPMQRHVNVSLALAQAFKNRGQEIIFPDIPGNAEKIHRAGFRPELLQSDAVFSGTLDPMMRQTSSLDKSAPSDCRAVR